MPDALRESFLVHRSGVVQLAELLSLVLLAYMVLVFGRFLLYWAGPGTPSGTTGPPSRAIRPPSSGTC